MIFRYSAVFFLNVRWGFSDFVFFSVMFGVLLLLFCVSVCCNLNFMLGLRWNALFDSFYFTDLYCTCGYLFQYLAFKWAYKHLRIMSTTSTQSRRKYMWTMVLSERYWEIKTQKGKRCTQVIFKNWDAWCDYYWSAMRVVHAQWITMQ